MSTRIRAHACRFSSPMPPTNPGTDKMNRNAPTKVPITAKMPMASDSSATANQQPDAHEYKKNQPRYEETQNAESNVQPRYDIYVGLTILTAHYGNLSYLR